MPLLAFCVPDAGVFKKVWLGLSASQVTAFTDPLPLDIKMAVSVCDPTVADRPVRHGQGRSLSAPVRFTRKSSLTIVRRLMPSYQT